jgi:hypothetical protein
MLSSALGLAVLLVCGLLVGWRWHGSVADTLAAIGLLLLRFALVWVGVYLGLVVRNPEAVAAVQVLVWPLGFLSNTIAPTATMPGWLGVVAEWNPITATITATRELFDNPDLGGVSWADQHALLMAVVWPWPSWPSSSPWPSTAGSGSAAEAGHRTNRRIAATTMAGSVRCARWAWPSSTWTRAPPIAAAARSVAALRSAGVSDPASRSVGAVIPSSRPGG